MKARPFNSHILILLCFLAGLIACDGSTSLTSKAIAGRTTVAIYSDQGCWEESVVALENMFEWMGYSVTLVDAKAVREEGLFGFRLFCVPGGDMYIYSHDLTHSGIENIREFVRRGGGYLGICAGSNFAGSRVIWRGHPLDMECLDLYQGTSTGPLNDIVPYPSYGMCEVDITDSTHPITTSLPMENWILYYWGPQFTPDPGAQVTILGRYAVTGGAAMMAFDYGEGRAFIIGSHPEIEEDSDRDSVSWGDDMDDQGTDWNLMKRAADWCLNKS